MKKLLLAGLLFCACSFAQNMPSALSQSTLTANVLATGSGPVSISAPFPFIPSAPLNQGVIYMDSEAMLVLSANLSLNQLTVLRGYMGTTAAAHNAGILAFSGQPFQFVSVDKSGSCDPNSPQFLNVADETYFSCMGGAWVGAATSNGGGGAGNPGGTNGQVQFNNNGVFGGLTSTGTGNVVRQTSPTLITPALGTPSALVLTNATGLPGGSILAASVPNSALVNSTLTVNGVTCTLGSGCTVSGASFYQTFQANGTPVTQRAKFNLAAGANTTVAATDNGTDTTTFTIAATGGGSGWSVGTLAARPSTCAAGAGYFATDQPPLQQLYTCSATNVWTQYLNIDSSGLAITGGTLGIDGTIIPCLSCANVLTATQIEPAGFKIAPVTVASLPSAASIAGTMRTVSDALSPTAGGTIVGGGALFRPVISDGTNWKSLY